jgi:para-nitrobenzyl esterase
MKKEGKAILKVIGYVCPKFIFALGLISFLIIGTVHNAAVVFADSKQSKDTPEQAQNNKNRHNTKITTMYGRVMGILDAENTWAWKGIPYAKPPVDELRWKAPQDPDPWHGVKQTKDDCEPCTQWGGTRTWQGTGEIIGSEDCLYLNIWRPQSDETNLPIYFWIHGGSNNTGSAALYNGSAIASRLNMVVVVIQYRLGPFGWFAHPSLRHGNPKDDSGNFGTLDHIKALEWVRDNIEAFGGDPDNITIAGESAGAHNVTNLLISPLAGELFHKAISQSGGMVIHSLDQGVARTEETISNLLEDDGLSEVPGGDTEAYLRSKSKEAIMIARLGPTGEFGAHSAYADGAVLPYGEGDNPPVLLDTIGLGNYNKVPIILGADEYEMKDFMPFFDWLPTVYYDEELNPIDGYLVTNYLKLHDIFNAEDPYDVDFDVYDEIFGDDSLTLLDATTYLPLATYDSETAETLYEICGKYGSRNWRAKFVDQIAVALDAQQDNVYAYLFRWGGLGSVGSGPQPFDFVFGAAHAMEIPFFFGGDESLFGYSFTEENRPGREELQDAMMTYVGQFARTGDPGTAYSVQWTEWSSAPGDLKVIVFDSNLVEVVLTMSDEFVDLNAVNWVELPAAVSILPLELQSIPYYFIWHWS